MKLILLLILALGFTACSSDDKEATKPSVLFGKVTAAASSVSGSITTTLSLAEPVCDRGDPTSSSPGDPAFPGEQAYCTLNINSKSPDTIQGSYFLVSKVMCVIEKTISFTYAALPQTHDGITIFESDDCFGDGGFDLDDNGNISGSITVSLSESAVPAGGAFDYYIGLQFTDTYAVGEVDLVQFFLKDSDGILAARMYQPVFGSVVDFSINSNDSTFSYENKDFDNTRHIRFWADGTFNDSGAFTSVEAAKFVQSQGEDSSGTVSIMNYTTTVEEYDHHINNSRQGGFSVIPTIPHDIDFYTWTGRAITDAVLLSAGPVDFSTTFDMSF